MKIIKKLTILVIACVFAIALYFTFGVKNVNAGSSYSYALSSQLSITDNFKFSVTVYDTTSTKTIKECTLTYYEYDKSTKSFSPVEDKQTFSSGNYASSVQFTGIEISAAAMFQAIEVTIIDADGNTSNNLSTTGYAMIVATKAALVDENKVALCDDLIAYSLYACDYYGTSPLSNRPGIATKLNKRILLTASDDIAGYALTGVKAQGFLNADGLHITGINFDCSSTSKIYLYLSANDSASFANYVFVDENGKAYETETTDDRLKVIIEFKFSELTTSKKLYVAEKTAVTTNLLSYDVFGLSYSYSCLNHFENDNNAFDLVVVAQSLAVLAEDAALCVSK